MNILNIVYDVKNFTVSSALYADKEFSVDFLHDRCEAELCTASFCAQELAGYLRRTDPGLKCVFSGRLNRKEPYILLECASGQFSDGGFSFIVKKENQLIIRGADRNGMVNGIYEFLRLQGWEWLEPGTDGEYAPKPHGIVFPKKNRTFKPSFKYRAFYFEFSSQASVDFLMWMARNRMNVYGSFPDLKPTAQKLGMYILSGGHVLTDFLKPDRLLETGKTLLESHPEWYGVREDGQKITAENAQRTQFCCSNGELMDYIADKLILKLNHEWKGTDILEISGFDTWGKTCQCPKCRKLTDSDKYMRFMASLRDRFNRAYAEGKLTHNPMLNTWAYEGTATMSAPTKIPVNMARAHDNCVAFVINRCYRHPMGDSADCPVNAKYARIFQSWGKFGKQLTLWGGEYYNVSRHEDLPLLFTDNIRKSMKFYYDAGARGITYMHTPILNWGVRTITQNLHAWLAWDIGLDVGSFCQKILKLRYGTHAGTASKVCSEIEKASLDVAEWRAWGESILCRFNEFRATGEAKEPLARRHYKNNADVIRNGWKIVAHFHKAAELTEKMFHTLWSEIPAVPGQALAVNPEEQNKDRIARRSLHILETELRALHYAEDVMSLMTGCAEAYDAVQKKDYAAVKSLCVKLEKQAKQMSLYTFDVTYRDHVPHIETRSALERSQCEKIIRLLKHYGKR